MHRIEIKADEITQVWRGARGSGDMMAGRGALIIRATSPGAEYPHTTIEIVGDAEGFAGLLDKVTKALMAEQW